MWWCLKNKPMPPQNRGWDISRHTHLVVEEIQKNTSSIKLIVWNEFFQTLILKKGRGRGKWQVTDMRKKKSKHGRTGNTGQRCSGYCNITQQCTWVQKCLNACCCGGEMFLVGWLGCWEIIEPWSLSLMVDVQPFQQKSLSIDGIQQTQVPNLPFNWCTGGNWLGWKWCQLGQLSSESSHEAQLWLGWRYQPGIQEWLGVKTTSPTFLSQAVI